MIFLLSFHVVSNSAGISMIPKDHLSFADTFVSVDDLIRDYNKLSLGERLVGEGVNRYLIGKLKAKGIIALTSDKAPSQYGHSITKTLYDSIETGMTYSEVIGILNQNGQELSRTEIAEIVTVMYQWVNEDGSNMNIIFQNGKVAHKAQFGL